MQLRNELNQQDYQKNIKRVYLSAFPKEECPPFYSPQICWRKGMFLVIEEGEQFIDSSMSLFILDLVYLAFLLLMKHAEEKDTAVSPYSFCSKDL